MADKKVRVGFTPGVGNDWSFVPMTTIMNDKGYIRFFRDPTSPKWKFVSFNPLPQDWSQSLNAAHTILSVYDPMIPKDGEFKYTITVQYKGTYYTSPPIIIGVEGPPIIINEG
jgi:hypothetical protein